jgi:hypothetical protein
MTKKYFLALVITVYATGNILAAGNPDSLFSTATKYYSEGLFDKALEHYRNIEAMEMESAELYFNMGNCFYKLNEYPKAILNYERALLLDPGDEDTQYNLSKVRFYNIDKIEEIPQFILRRWLNGIIMLFHSNIWAVVSLVTFIAGLVMLLLYLISMKISVKRIGFYAGLVLLLISIGSYIVSSKSKQLVLESSGAIVMVPSVTVKAAPRNSGTDLFIIHEGTKVYVMNSIDDWFEIKLSDGKQGWLLKGDVEFI